MTTQHSFFDILYNSTLAAVIALFVVAMSPNLAFAQEEATEDDSATTSASVELTTELTTEPATEPAIAPTAVEERLHAAFLADETVTVTERVGDLFAAGQLVIVRGYVDDNSFVVGETVKLEAERFGGDVFAGAQSLVIDSEIDGDLYIAGSQVVISPDAVVHGDVWCGGEIVRIEGAVDGQVHCGAGRVSIAGIVGGDVTLEVGEVKIEDGARLEGSLDYTSPDTAEIADGATIAGEVEFTKQQPGEGCAGDTDCDRDKDDSGSIVWFMISNIWSFLGALIVGFVMLALGGVGVRRIGRALTEQPGSSVGIGFVMFAVIPLASVLAICLLITMQLGFISLVAYLVGMYLAMLVAAYAFGDLLLRRGFHQEEPSPYMAMAAGLAVLHLFMMIPFVGFLVKIVAIIAGLGAAWVAARDRGNGPETVTV